MHVGMEVEGRYKGLVTLFVDLEDVDKVTSDMIEQLRLQQIYLRELVEWPVSVDVSKRVAKWVAMRCLVTVDCKKVVGEITDPVTVILSFKGAERGLGFLRATDQIKVIGGADDIVYVSPLEAMVQTVSADYAEDVSYIDK